MLYFSGIILYIHSTVQGFHTNIPRVTCTQRHCHRTPTPRTCFDPRSPVFICTCLVLIAVVVAVTHTVSTYLIKRLTYLVCAPPTPGCICCPLLVLAPHGLCIVGGCMLSKWGWGAGVWCGCGHVSMTTTMCSSSSCPLSAE